MKVEKQTTHVSLSSTPQTPSISTKIAIEKIMNWTELTLVAKKGPHHGMTMVEDEGSVG